MNDYNQHNRSGRGRGGRSGGFRNKGRDFGRRNFGGGDSERIMHRATCAQCGSDCEVPFRPSGDRPVYCNNCFDQRNRDDSNSRGADRREYGGRPRFEERRSPPVFNNGENINTQTAKQIIDQLKNLNIKLDKIINALALKKTEPETAEDHVNKIKLTKKKSKEEKIEI